MLRFGRKSTPTARPDEPLSLMGHLLELKQRVTKVVITLVITTALSFAFVPWIFHILLYPSQGLKPIFIELTEMVGIYMKVSLLSGFVLALPMTLYQAAMFVAPGLTTGERRYLFIMLPVAVLLFMVGVTFGYFVLIPPGINFLLTFGTDIAAPQIRIGSYINLVSSILFWIGLSFELPLLGFVLARIGILSPRILSQNRRLAVVCAFLLGAVITPTFDPVNQTLIAVPFIVLYEVSIWVSKLAARLRRRAASKGTESQHSGAQG